MANPKNNMARNLIIILAVCLLVAILGKVLGWWGKEQLTQVAVEKVSNQDLVESVSASGKIQPVKEVKISPDVSGEIVELKVKEGDHVEKGQLLAKIRPDVYEANLNRSVSNVNQAKAQFANSQQMLSQAIAQFKNTESVYNRTTKLFNDKVVSQSEFDKSASDYEAAKANISGLKQSVEAARYTIASAQASVKESSDNLAKTTIFSPVQGTVSKLNVELGERVVGTSQMAGTELMRIANLSAMEAKVDVNENDINRLNLGDTATIEVDAFRGRKFTAVVYQIGSSSNTTTSTTSVDQVTDFTVKIMLLPESYSDITKGKPNQDAPFKPGLSTSVEIQTKKVKGALVIPIQAVTTRTDSVMKTLKGTLKLSAKDSNSTKSSTKTGKSGTGLQEVVFVFKNGVVQMVPIVTGIQDQFHIQILKGLKAGDEVVIAPNLAITSQLKDGQKVEKVALDKISYSDKK